MSDPLRIDLDALDPSGESLLDARERAARPTDREWVRLRAVDAAAKALVLAQTRGEDGLPEAQALVAAIWPQEKDDER